ncbi:hypothetical protein [Streptomyces sp. NPDC020607]|uniref:hypothetical protein n=1 Tax=Streptomyces sp. NPDC020607 TaxID=3365082 RepID=UPI0037A31A03
MPATIPIPPFPRWTGMKATLGSPLRTSGGIQVSLSFHVTKRARLWMLWLRLTGKEVPDAAPR